MSSFSPCLQVMTKILGVTGIGLLSGVVLRNKNLSLYSSVLSGSCLAIFYAVGGIGEKYAMKKWKVRLLQGFLLGTFVGILSAFTIAQKEPSLIGRIFIVAIPVILFTWQSVLNAVYLKNYFPERIMQGAFEESFLGQLVYFGDETQDKFKELARIQNELEQEAELLVKLSI